MTEQSPKINQEPFPENDSGLTTAKPSGKTQLTTAEADLLYNQAWLIVDRERNRYE